MFSGLFLKGIEIICSSVEICFCGVLMMKLRHWEYSESFGLRFNLKFYPLIILGFLLLRGWKRVLWKYKLKTVFYFQCAFNFLKCYKLSCSVWFSNIADIFEFVEVLISTGPLCTSSVIFFFFFCKEMCWKNHMVIITKEV